MDERPILSRNMDSETFRAFYFLKGELVKFCKENGLPASGGKIEITDRIAHFLETGHTLSPRGINRKSTPKIISTLNEDMRIEANFICSEKHRVFFKERIGKSFSFNVPFQRWLKENAGKTYKEAIDAYHRILAEKKKGRTTIDKQFEYNTYIRDFFADNKGKSLAEAIRCWNYKKRLKGHNRYEKADLIALEC